MSTAAASATSSSCARRTPPAAARNRPNEDEDATRKNALVVGVTGISGANRGRSPGRGGLDRHGLVQSAGGYRSVAPLQPTCAFPPGTRAALRRQ